jgi:glutaredoxin/glutathione-dependent peroxiredoxin
MIGIIVCTSILVRFFDRFIFIRGFSMTIKIGDTMPNGTFKTMTAEGPKDLATAVLFNGKKVLLVSVPGAFTPTCSNKHLPGYVQQAAALRAKGIDTIAFTAVNDVHVMNAWGNSANVGDAILMLADGSGDYVKALGLELDLNSAGMGLRGKRFSMLIDNGVVKQLNIEPPGKFDVSSAECALSQL